jgi:quercetin dioxygenase-like cupin family protein
MKVKKSQETHFGLTFLATGKETGGRYFLSDTIVPSGDSGPPIHSHSKEEEGFYLKNGKLTFIVEGKEIQLNKAEYLNIEEGEEHTWRNDSESDAELIITFAPAGIEHMFRELEINKANIKVIGQKYGADFQIG